MCCILFLSCVFIELIGLLFCFLKFLINLVLLDVLCYVDFNFVVLVRVVNLEFLLFDVDDFFFIIKE